MYQQIQLFGYPLEKEYKDLSFGKENNNNNGHGENDHYMGILKCWFLPISLPRDISNKSDRSWDWII